MLSHIMMLPYVIVVKGERRTEAQSSVGPKARGSRRGARLFEETCTYVKKY